jgi:hypothetical protein
VIVALPCALLIAASGVCGAQGATAGSWQSWQMRVAATPNPVARGSCSPVTVTMFDPATRDVPRDPTGMRLSLRDFDMAVSTPQAGAVAGEYKGPGYFAVCACQAGTVGTVATITATYPAAGLPARSTIPGVAFQLKDSVVLSAPTGTFEQAACSAAKALPFAGGGLAVAMAPTAMPAGSAPPRGGTIASAPPIAAAPNPGLGGAPVRGGAGAPPQAAPPGAIPPKLQPQTSPGSPDLQIWDSEPMIAELGWYTVPNATRYAVYRQSGTGPSVVVPQVWGGVIDTVPDPRATYHYTLVTTFANGTSAQSAPVDFISPPLENPTGLVAANNDSGGVNLAWDHIHGAVSYRVDGPGLPNTGVAATQVTFLDSTGTWISNRVRAHLPNVPPVNATFKVVAIYAGNNADYANPSTITLRVSPSHPTRWLSKNNGPGSAAQTAAHYLPRTAGTSLVESDLLLLTNVSTFRSWMNNTAVPGNPLGQWNVEAWYGNSGDLGVGRRTDCFQEVKGPPVSGLRTVCYAAAHGIAPGKPGFNDLATITAPGRGQGAGFILAMMIIKDPAGTQFLVFNAVDATHTKLANTATLDTEGPKLVPHTCISCHGGQYNPTTRLVDNAQFLPLDPELLSFLSPVALSQQQEKIRQLNVMMMNSDKTSVVARYIRGLYRGAPTQVGAVAQPDYVPSGWSQQPGLYRQVVRPYCVMCHLAGPSNLAFDNYGTFSAAGPMIFAAVCKAHTMPHAELQFREFWTKPTGAINIPGLLALTTGNQSCQ